MAVVRLKTFSEKKIRLNIRKHAHKKTTPKNQKDLLGQHNQLPLENGSV